MSTTELPKIHWLSLAIGLLAAPLAWMMQMNVSEIVTSRVCAPMPRPLVSWLYPALTGISGMCLLLAIFSVFFAWNDWQTVKHHSLHTGDGHTRFLALMSVMSSGLFTVAIILTTLTILLVSPC